MIYWLFFFSLCLSVFLPVSAGAIDWRNDYTVDLTVERDDNFRLTEDDPVETTSTDLFVSGELRGEMEVSNFQLGVQASTTTYSESSIEDSENYGLFFNSQRRGERSLGSLDLSYFVEPTTQTELLDTGNRVDGERESQRIAPGISFQVDERNSIYADLELIDVSYDTVSLTEYTDNTITVGWVSQLRETSEISINGSVSEYDPDNDDSTTITGFYMGYGFTSSETTRYALTLGYAESDTPNGTDSSGTSSIEIQYSPDEHNAFSLFVGNGYEGSGVGEVRNETRLNLSWDRALAERMQLVVTAEGVQSDEGSLSEDRNYFEILAGFRYQYSRELSFDANYRHRAQHTDTIDADSNSIMFSLRYSLATGFRHEL